MYFLILCITVHSFYHFYVQCALDTLYNKGNLLTYLLNLGSAVRVCSMCLRLYITRHNTQPTTVGFDLGSHTPKLGAIMLDHCDNAYLHYMLLSINVLIGRRHIGCSTTASSTFACYFLHITSSVTSYTAQCTHFTQSNLDDCLTAKKFTS